jgi:hypothetical protein
MTQRRLRQANLFGPAGFVSADDGEVIEFSQDGFRQAGEGGRRFDDWPEFFTEDGRYHVQARENFDRQLPLSLMALESKGMMKDRVYGITQTIYHGPYYTRHVVGPVRVLGDGRRCDPRRGQLRGVSHQARQCERGLQRGPLYRRHRTQQRRLAVRKPALCV